MPDITSDAHDTGTLEQDPQERADHTRRRALVGALAAGAVGMTVVGRPDPASAAPPDPGSVKPEHFHADAIDPAATVPGARTLGPGATQAAPGSLVAEVAAKETPGGAASKVSEAMLSLPELVAGSNIEVREVLGDTTEIAVVNDPTFELANGSTFKLDTLGAFERYSLQLTDGADTHPSVVIAGRELAGVFGLGAFIQFGTGSASPDTIIHRAGNGVLEVLGAAGQLISNSPRIDHTAAGLTVAKAHRSATVCMTGAAAATVTFGPLATNGLSPGSRGTIVQHGAGAITFVGASGVTIRSMGGRVTSAGQWSTISWWVASTTEVVISGDLV